MTNERAALSGLTDSYAAMQRRQPRPKVWFLAQNRHVEYLQRRLEHHGIYKVCLGDDYGRFGSATEQAVRAFQTMHQLPATGIVDPDTWQAIDGPTPSEQSDDG